MGKNSYEPSVEVKIDDEMLRGEYSNMLQIAHGKEEFIIDYMSIFGDRGIIVARLIVSPSHFKQMMKAFEDNMRKYEAEHGAILDVVQREIKE